MCLAVMALVFPYIITSTALGMKQTLNASSAIQFCADPCRISLVESIPYNLTYTKDSPSFLSTFQAWKYLIQAAQSKLDIASFYWTLKGSDVPSYQGGPASQEGEEIFRSLLNICSKRKVSVRISQNQNDPRFYPTSDFDELQSKGAEVRILNFTKWFGAGILHTKLIIVDNLHFYVGSANMDFRSLTEVKELGLLVSNCSCLAQDISKIFEVYWYMGKSDTVPAYWPKEWSTLYNIEKPINLTVNESHNATVFITSSPPPFCTTGRTSDIDGLLYVIDSAEEFISIAVMDYLPAFAFSKLKRFWPKIDTALRKAAINKGQNMTVRFLASYWKHTDKSMLRFLQSLQDISGGRKGDTMVNIQVKLFVVPDDSYHIDYTRVNHNKYMVTDKHAYIGTSNWSADYFVTTGGIGVIISDAAGSNSTSNSSVVAQLNALFDRDWNSPYAHPLNSSYRAFR